MLIRIFATKYIQPLFIVIDSVFIAFGWTSEPDYIESASPY
jgi:hypothetical protein